MAETNAIIDINTVVNDFLFKYRVPKEDGLILLAHACDCWQDIRVKHSNEVTTEKVSIDSLGIIEMPDSMMNYVKLGVYKNGELWTFTERPDIVNTTTTVDEVETRSATYDEDDDAVDGSSTTYGSKGAVNAYYYALDWDARRIFCHGITSDTGILKYVSSGISTTGTTYVPRVAIPMIDSYMMWKKSYWDGANRPTMADRERDFIRQRDEFRNVQFPLTLEQLLDVIWGSSTQGPTR